ncbi:MarR family winged helix-turn-helix transcriptional regulator [Agromyces salentinus]|uniref:HTH marR-type domain-containing protein n=1 Tax=Agromyces salentinus TaxID=269421 RepID=A0ABN2N0X7_9MICO|nr:MarR family transcriptional regulator [Agromyces salentinus]
MGERRSSRRGTEAGLGSGPVREPGPDAERPAEAMPLGFVTASVGELVASGFRDALAPHGVSPRQYAVLWALVAHGEHTQQQLSERLGIPASRVVALIDDLERRGAVQRVASDRDRRIRTVRLTDDGRRLVEDLRATAYRYERDLLRDLTDDEQRVLRSLLARMGSNVGRGGSAARIRSW